MSTSAPLVHAASPMPAMTVASLRVLGAGLAFAVLAGPKLAQFFALRRRAKALTLLASVFLAAHFGAWISSLYFTSTAASTALVALQPVFAALIGWLALRERAGRREWVGIGCALIGAVFLARGDSALGHEVLLGDLLAVLGALFAAAYLAVGRTLREELPLMAHMAWVHLCAGVLLCAVAALWGAPFLGHEPGSYWAILACIALPSVIGHSLLNWCVRQVPVHLVSLGILGEPVGASLLAWVWFQEVPPWHAVAGGAILLAGIAVGFTKR